MNVFIGNDYSIIEDNDDFSRFLEEKVSPDTKHCFEYLLQESVDTAEALEVIANELRGFLEDLADQIDLKAKNLTGEDSDKVGKQEIIQLLLSFHNKIHQLI